MIQVEFLRCVAFYRFASVRLRFLPFFFGFRAGKFYRRNYLPMRTLTTKLWVNNDINAGRRGRRLRWAERLDVSAREGFSIFDLRRSVAVALRDSLWTDALTKKCGTFAKNFTGVTPLRTASTAESVK